MSVFSQTIIAWQKDPTSLTPSSWKKFISHLAPLNFIPGTLLIDTALWGSFWQGDVIAPGYTLPLLELIYLRNVRLEETFDFPSPDDFLQALQSALEAYPAALWTTTLLNKPTLCVQQKGFFIWLVEAGIAGAYANEFPSAPGFNLTPLIVPLPQEHPPQPNPYYEETLADFPALWRQWQDEWPAMNNLSRLDCLIQTHRAHGFLSNSATQAIQQFIKPETLNPEL